METVKTEVSRNSDGSFSAFTPGDGGNHKGFICDDEHYMLAVTGAEFMYLKSNAIKAA